MGFSKFGTYEGNGVDDGPFVYCGFKPAWLWIKNYDTAQQWHLFDNARTTINKGTVGGRIYSISDLPNVDPSPVAENIDFLSNGFKMRDNGIGTNQSGQSILFFAFAKHPFGGEDVTPVTAE